MGIRIRGVLQTRNGLSGHSERCSKSPGFTLLELLLVIAVITVLAGQLVATLSQTAQRSRSAVCKSNLRQLAVALRAYLDDSSAVYPYAASAPAKNPKGISFWFDALATELPNVRWGDGIFKCPSYKGLTYGGQIRNNNRLEITGIYFPCGSYAYNAAGRRPSQLRHMELVSAGLGFTAFAGQAIERPVREDDLKAPSDLYVIGDSPLALAAWGPGSMPKLGGAADYNVWVAENTELYAVHHAHIFNMLFADMHAESVKTNILVDTDTVFRRRWNHDNGP